MGEFQWHAAFRGGQLFEFLHKQQQPERFADITVFPKKIAGRIRMIRNLWPPATEVSRQESRDGTVKSLMEFRDGKRAECVSIPGNAPYHLCLFPSRFPRRLHLLCFRAKWCGRDLTAGEIVYQVLHHHRHRPVTHIVFMGSGEPLFNYDNVLRPLPCWVTAKVWD